MERSAGEASTSGMEDPRDHASPYFPDRMLSSSGALHEAKARRQIRDAWAFWLLGLLNNSAYVIMIAGANEISSGAVGLTYLCAIIPSLLVKSTGPYWFHRISYRSRSCITAVLMSMSYCVVAFGRSLVPQLVGVVLGSLQGGLGEASCLAMASFYDSRRVITFWSSGTGFAGVFGYTWVVVLHILAKLSFKTTLLLANISSVAWLAVYFLMLESPEQKQSAARALMKAGSDKSEQRISIDRSHQADLPGHVAPEDQDHPLLQRKSSSQEEGKPEATEIMNKFMHMGFRERWRRTVTLWPYIVPLVLVYFAEYSMQAGTWTSIGFPVTEKAERNRFYSFSNWCYQLGVFISRSSGMIFQADLRVLWIMPMMQIGLFVFFTLDAWLHFWMNWWLLILCLFTGLLGGGVYVNAFTLISKDIDPKYKEFSLAAASLGDSLGIAFADVAGILIQGCLFKLNSIPGADFNC